MATQPTLDWRSHRAPAWKLPHIGSHPISAHGHTSRDSFARELEAGGGRSAARDANVIARQRDAIRRSVEASRRS
jgi:hypothetical protein